MPDISGVLTTHLRALGAGTRDRAVFAILTRNPQFIEDEPVTAADGEVRVDMRNTVDGLLLRFSDGELDSVRVTGRRPATPSGPVDLESDFHPYPAPADLIRGLDISSATRADVIAALGAPDEATSDTPADAGSDTSGPVGSEGSVAAGSQDLTYRVDGGFLRLRFDGDQLLTVTTSRA